VNDLRQAPSAGERALSPGRINAVLKLLRSVFRVARRRKLIADNPIEYVERLREARPEVDPFDLNEVRKNPPCTADTRYRIQNRAFAPGRQICPEQSGTLYGAFNSENATKCFPRGVRAISETRSKLTPTRVARTRSNSLRICDWLSSEIA
jgi:hypothetical protein